MALTILRPTQFTSNTSPKVVEVSRAQAHQDMAPYLGDETADEVLDLMVGHGAAGHALR